MRLIGRSPVVVENLQVLIGCRWIGASLIIICLVMDNHCTFSQFTLMYAPIS